MSPIRPVRYFAPALLLSAVACSQAPQAKPPATREEVRATRATDLRDTQALLLLMADQKRFEEGVFVALLDASPSVRRDLAVALGRIGDARGRGLLQGLLIDTEASVRQAAAFSLGELGSPEAVPALIRAAVDDDPSTGTLAVEALGKLRAPLADVLRPLTALEPDDSARRLAPALFRFKEDGVVAAAAGLLGSSEPAVHSGAAYALAREARPAGLPFLRQLAADPESQVRGWAARGLGEVGDLSDLSRLEALLADAGASPRIQALRAGARILARTQAVAPLSWGRRLALLVFDAQPGVRAAALEGSPLWLAQPEVRAAVLDRLAKGEPRERELALLALAQTDDPEAEAAARQAAVAPERALRARAAEAAGALGLADVAETLAVDRDAAVRVAAVEALFALGGDPAEEPAAAAGAVAGIARRFLADPDPTVRATALEALSEAPGLSVDELGRAVAASEADLLADARLSGIRALAARALAAPAEHEAAVARLEQLSEDKEYLVRREAATALERLGQPRPEVGPVATGRTGPVYSQILLQTEHDRRVEVTTSRGSFRIRLTCPEAPLTCLSFLQLAGQGYFDGLSFHRVVPDFVVQTGDPRGDGWGGPGFALRDEINRLRFGRGAVGMALSGPDTGGSQFFIALAPQPHLDGGYTVFGQVEGGDAVLDQIRQEDELVTIREVETGE